MSGRRPYRQGLDGGPTIWPLLDVYDGAPTWARESGADWYPRHAANCRAMARQYNTDAPFWTRDAWEQSDRPMTARRVAGVIAALSPRIQWVRNLECAVDVLEHRVPRCLGRSAHAAAVIRDGARPLDVLGGPKTRAFYRNLTGDLSAVTVDVHAAKAAGVDPDTLGRRGVYDDVAQCYRIAADHRGLAPAIFQAIVWCAWRGRAD